MGEDQKKGDGSLGVTVGRVDETAKAKPEGMSRVTSAYKAFVPGRGNDTGSPCGWSTVSKIRKQ